MLTLKHAVIFIAVPFMLFSYTNMRYLIPVEVEGTVLDAASGQPVTGAHLYIVLGEEETISSKQGKFKITTWQNLPATLTIDQKDYHLQKVSIAGPLKNYIIRLKKK